MRIRNLLLLVSLLFVSACSPSPEELAPTIVAATISANETATSRAQEAIAEFASMTAAAITPSTTPSLTPTVTPTPLPPALIALETTFVKSGPDNVYETVALMTAGTEIELLGRLEDGTWILVGVTDGKEGWLPANGINYPPGFDDLPVVEPPIPPTPPPLITVTVNNTNGDYPAQMSATDETGKTISVTVPKGEIRSFTIPTGTYTLVFVLAPRSDYAKERPCIIKLTVNTNIVWNARGAVTDACSTFP